MEATVSAWESANLACVFRFSDSLHPKARAAAAALGAAKWRDQGMRLMMLTGDNPASANTIAEKVGLSAESVNAGLTPADKLRIVEEARREAQANDDVKYKR